MFIDHLVGTLGGTLLLANFLHLFFGVSLTLTSLFLILLVLVQRGRGGGLAGAFGGMGGQSAFGAKAGDTFTKVTIGVSIFWLLLCVGSVKLLGTSSGSFGKATPPTQTQFVPELDGSGPGAADESGAAEPAGAGGEASVPAEDGPETDGN
jgi:preprotein translocase subunit SecG